MLDPNLAAVLNKAADIAAVVCFGGLVVFIILYMSLYQWRKRKAGKSVLLLAWSFVLIAGISTAALWISPDFWFRPVFRTAAWFFGVYSVGYLVYALLYNWKNRHPIEIPRKDRTAEIPIQEER